MALQDIIYAGGSKDSLPAGAVKINSNNAALAGTGGAAEIGYNSATSGLGVSTAQAAIDAIDSNVDAHISNAAAHLTSAQNTWIDAITATSTEVNYLSGVTSAIQTQIDSLSSGSGTNILDYVINFNSINIATSLLPTNSGSVRIYASENCLIEFATALSTPIYLLQGTDTFGIPAGATHISVKGLISSGYITVSGLATTYKYSLTTNTSLSVQSTSSRVALPSGIYVRLCTDENCYIEFGDNTVNATTSSTLLEAGTDIIRVPEGASYIAAIRETNNGSLYISGVN